MPANRWRFIWPGLCVVLVAALIGNTFHWQKKLRAAATKFEQKSKSRPLFDKRESGFFRALAAGSGYETTEPWQGADAARLAAYERIERNKMRAQMRGGDPETFPTRELVFTQRTAIPLAPTMAAALGGPFTHYRWELTNKSDRTLAAPILYQDDRWDSAEALVAHAGFSEISNETERALAIWRFVCARRVFGDPPTEGREEHDVLKFLGSYGYGFCDDTARALAALAELSGLRGRVWSLHGHVVAEVFADGRWRMLDADQQAYFYKAGAPREILGVEDLATDPQAFTHLVSWRGVNEYSPVYRACFLSREDNAIDGGGTHEHRLQPALRSRERITLTNYNWGRYFLGKYPTPPPRFYNGFFTYEFQPGDLVPLAGTVTADPIAGGHRLGNSGGSTASARLDFASPFPIVGGSITGTAAPIKGRGALRIEDSDHGRVMHADLAGGVNISLDRLISVLTAAPTYRYSLTLTLAPGTIVELRDFVVTSDFQFARLPLLSLQSGANSIRAHFPAGSDPAAFELIISTK